MDISLMQFLIVCPMCLVGGFVDAIVGGGGLIYLPSYLMAGLPVHFAIGTNRINSTLGSTVAAIKYAKDGYVPWKKAAFCLVASIIGSFVGARLALMFNEKYFMYFMLIVLPLTGIWVVFSKLGSALDDPSPKCDEASGKSENLVLVLATAFSFLVGAYDGFYGPGSGTFLLLLLTGAAGLTIKESNGISKLIFMVTNLTAFFVFLGEGKMIISLGVAAGIFAMVGNYLGARYFEKANEKVLKGLILFVLSIFMIKVLVGLFF